MAAAEDALALTIVPAPLLDIDGSQMLAALRSALTWLEVNQEQTNDLNVFPVPDGDTGSNMYLTMRSAVEDAGHAPDPDSAAGVMAAAARGSLMGARGNSGVILSQVLRGFSVGLAGEDRVGASRLAAALGEASSVAYRAVMKPTEGTILTVVRDAAAAAGTAAEGTSDVRYVLDRAVREAHAAVERTMDQLPVLKQAGVVDAGGFGFAVILEGFCRSLEAASGGSPLVRAPRRRAGEPRVRVPGVTSASPRAPAAGEAAAPPNVSSSANGTRRGAAAVEARADGWGYCTEFLVHGPGLDIAALRATLEPMGDSALVVGDADLIRVHLHTAEPARVIASASEAGRLSKLKVDDMSAQHHDILDRAAGPEGLAGSVPGSSESPAVPAPPSLDVASPKRLGVVSVAPGDGFRAILNGLGVDGVVEGGQTMNPSIEDLLRAVQGAEADAVILLPNNGNVILTAQQVNALADDVNVAVVPTHNLPQGIAALLAFDPEASVDDNCAVMGAAAARVRAISVTRAVRNAKSNGLTIKTGDVIALVDDEIAHAGKDELTVINAVLDGLGAPPELITVYRGAGVAEDDADRVVAALQGRHADAEFQLHDGGQEHYPYVLSVE